VIVVDDFGAVLAVDPTDAELARVLRRGRG
jgi:hypothetical protein